MPSVAAMGIANRAKLTKNRIVMAAKWAPKEAMGKRVYDGKRA